METACTPHKLCCNLVAYRRFTTSPIVRGNRTRNHGGRTCSKKLCSPVTTKQVEEDGNSNMRGVTDAITTTMITVHLFRQKIVSTAVCITIIPDDLTRTEQMEGSWYPDHVKNCKNWIWYDWKNYQCLDFTYDLCSNLCTVRNIIPFFSSFDYIMKIKLKLEVLNDNSKQHQLMLKQIILSDWIICILAFRNDVPIRIRRTIAIDVRMERTITNVIRIAAARKWSSSWKKQKFNM